MPAGYVLITVSSGFMQCSLHYILNERKDECHVIMTTLLTLCEARVLFPQILSYVCTCLVCRV